MLLPDVNVLIYAHVEDSTPDHAEYAAWITRLATGPEPFALSVLVLSGFVRIVTNPRVKERRNAFERLISLNIETPPDPAELSRELEEAHAPGHIY